MLPEEAKKDHEFIIDDNYKPLDNSNESRVYNCKKCGMRCINHSDTDTDIEFFQIISQLRPMSTKYPFYYIYKGSYYGNNDVLLCVEMMIKDIIE